MKKKNWHKYFSTFKLLYLYLLTLCTCDFSQQWAENGEYEYYYNSSALATVLSYNDAVSKCADQSATLVMIKTEDVEGFILAQKWESKLSTCLIL